MNWASSKKMSSTAHELRDRGLEDAMVEVDIRRGRDR